MAADTHFHVCDSCFAVMGHKPAAPAPCSHHDCRKCGEEVDRTAYSTYREAAEEAARLKAAA